jgi:hypothetical protein
LPHEADAQVLILALAQQNELSYLDLSSPRFVGASVMPVLASCTKLQSLRLHGEYWRLQRLQEDEGRSGLYGEDDFEQTISLGESGTDGHESFPYKLHALLKSEKRCPWWSTVRCLRRFEAITAHSCSWDEPLQAWEGACRGEMDCGETNVGATRAEHSRDNILGEAGASEGVDNGVPSLGDRNTPCVPKEHPLLPVLQLLAPQLHALQHLHLPLLNAGILHGLRKAKAPLLSVRALLVLAVHRSDWAAFLQTTGRKLQVLEVSGAVHMPLMLPTEHLHEYCPALQVLPRAFTASFFT